MVYSEKKRLMTRISVIVEYAAGWKADEEMYASSVNFAMDVNIICIYSNINDNEYHVHGGVQLTLNSQQKLRICTKNLSCLSIVRSRGKRIQ